MLVVMRNSKLVKMTATVENGSLRLSGEVARQSRDGGVVFSPSVSFADSR